jgi:hypothetical protein|tara:strand:+ start:1090 stop:1482 length:393 start_codon:yes stop_codon:yes gene_type:complete
MAPPRPPFHRDAASRANPRANHGVNPGVDPGANQGEARRFGRTIAASASGAASAASAADTGVDSRPVAPLSPPDGGGRAVPEVTSPSPAFEESAPSASDLFNAMVDSQKDQALRAVQTVLDQVWRTYGLK